MQLGALVYLYRRRLRVHGVQELLAGLGVACSVALVFATLVASASVAGSSAQLVHTVAGSATLQLRAHDSDGFGEALLARVERLPGVRQAAPLLEQTATLQAAGARRLTVDLAGADTALTVLDGLAHTLPRAALAPGGIGLSSETARQLAIAAAGTGTVTLLLRGEALALRVSDVLGPEAFSALSQANVAVMPLEDLQRLAGLRGRITRILVQPAPGREAAVRAGLARLAGGSAEVTTADQDVGLLRQALRPSDEASTLFATISVLLGVLLAGGALLLTVPERRRAIADLRLLGTRRSAIVQMLLFQALCLGLAASLLGLAGGYALSRGVLHQSSGYLAEAFTLGTNTLVSARPLLLALGAGVLATCVASALPLLDLRRSQAIDAVYREQGVPGNTLSAGVQRGLALAGLLPLTGATLLFAIAPAQALIACELLALATVLFVPLTLSGVLRAAQALSERRQRMTALPVALASLRGARLRSLALAGTGALALFGGIALGGARADLLHGVQRFAHDYAAEADIWVGAPGDNQATVDFRAAGLAGRIERIPGVASVSAFSGGFTQLDGRRVWILARPPAVARELLAGQIVAGNPAEVQAKLQQGGWIAVSAQIAREHDVGVGATLEVPTQSGSVAMRIAATTTNLAWSPGALVMSAADYARLSPGSAPTALDVRLAQGASLDGALAAVRRALGGGSGLRAISAREREASIDALTSEGLSRLGEISTLLILAATLVMAAALSSAIWQRRVSLAALRLSGVRPRRVRVILLVEAALMLGAGCLTGVLAGIFGQLVIDGYLTYVTGFPVANPAASPRTLEILVLVVATVLAIVTLPAWLASRVSPTLALNE